MGLIATPFFLLMRLIISDRYKYKGYDDPYIKGSLYIPMNYSKHDLRNCNIWTKSLNWRDAHYHPNLINSAQL